MAPCRGRKHRVQRKHSPVYLCRGTAMECEVCMARPQGLRERERSLKDKFYLNGGKERDQEKQGDGR